jgi:hypothetical protein
MSKKRYWDIQVREKGNRPAYSVPVRSGLKHKAIKEACVSGLIAEGDCELIDSATEITKEQYTKMLGTDRVKPEIVRFEEREHENTMMRKGKEVKYDEWLMEVDVKANNMSEAKRLAFREVYRRTRDINYPKKKLHIEDCESIGEHMFRCRSRI